jgi:hypothetical protein
MCPTVDGRPREERWVGVDDAMPSELERSKFFRLGSFLRAFGHGHVRQLQAVSRDRQTFQPPGPPDQLEQLHPQRHDRLGLKCIDDRLTLVLQ